MIKLTSLAILLTILLSCGTTKDIETENVEVVYEAAKKFFAEEDWLEATKYFEIIKLQFPASQYADDAQYYLAEIHFKKGDYILAAFNYNRLRTTYPNSEYTKEALFKAALSYFELSPPYDRDQEYTRKAIDAFNLYQRLYPNENQYADAGNYINTLRQKLALREYFTAELYRKVNELESALVYYQSVIDDYPDSIYFEPAYYAKIELLAVMKKYDEAIGLIDLYKKLFPESQFIDKANSIAEIIKSSKP